MVFSLTEDGVSPLRPAAFDREVDLQRLIEQAPELLGGSLMTPEDPRRFLLIASEAPLTDRAGGGQRYSVDSLFVDQDAVPTLVEVKRATNRELRRDVVGQMFDYAANAIRFWTVDDLEAAAELTHGNELHKVFQSHTVTPVEAFWAATQENLRQGRVRLMFVADEIPIELQTIVEFANETSREAEVLAVEVRQYSSSTSTVLVPRLFGQTSVARHRRRLEGPGFQELFDRAPHDVQRAVRLLRDWAAEHEVTEVHTDRGLRLAMGDVHLMYVQPGNHSIQLTMKSIRSGDADLATELMAMLEGFSSRDNPLTDKHPQLPLVDVRDHWDRVRNDFLPAYLRGRLRHSARRPLW